jgi:hypothetical protein
VRLLEEELRVAEVERHARARPDEGEQDEQAAAERRDVRAVRLDHRQPDEEEQEGEDGEHPQPRARLALDLGVAFGGLNLIALGGLHHPARLRVRARPRRRLLGLQRRPFTGLLRVLLIELLAEGPQ